MSDDYLLKCLWKGVADVEQQQDAADHIEKLERALEIYKRERDRYRHNKPEITGEYFLTGGQGDVDKNQLPEYVRICPAYGCAWEQLYVKTDRTVSYEGG